MEEIFRIIIGIVFGFLVIVLLIFGLIVIFVFPSQVLEKGTWGNYKFVVKNDQSYWYTNEIKKEGNCISFVDNYQKNVKVCEKFSAENNYWYNNSPSLKTVIWQPN